MMKRAISAAVLSVMSFVGMSTSPQAQYYGGPPPYYQPGLPPPPPYARPYSDPYRGPYGGPYARPYQPQSYAINCGQGAEILAANGFHSISVRECSGRIFRYTAYRGRAAFEVRVASSSGEITRVRQI